MYRIAKFEKVSFEQFKKDWIDTFSRYAREELDEGKIDIAIRNIYDSIKLPKRATAKSAGYDFFSPINLILEVNEAIKIPTGIRCWIDDGWYLKGHPRSGYGFKYGVKLANTTGIIDGDYYDAKNEGHIFFKLVNDSVLAKRIEFNTGDAFCQGIFSEYGLTLDDDVTEARTGGFGSTTKQSNIVNTSIGVK